MSYPGVALSVCKLHFLSFDWVQGDFHWRHLSTPWGCGSVEGVPAGDSTELQCWALSIWKNIFEGHLWKSGLFWVFLTCVRHSRVISLTRQRVFGLESSRSAGDLSATWLMPLAECWCHLRESALLRAHTKCWEVSLEGNSLFMDLVSNLLLGFCLQRCWTVPKGVFSAGSRHSSTQGCNFPAE